MQQPTSPPPPPAAWQRLDRTQRAVIAALAVATLLAIVLLAGGGRARAIEAVAVGIWSCTGSFTDTPEQRDGSIHEQRADLPAPFDRLDPPDNLWLETHRYRPPQSPQILSNLSVQVIITPQGHIEISGPNVLGDPTVTTGSWTREHDLLIITLNEPDPGRWALDVRPGQDRTDVLTWQDDNQDSFDLYEVALDWQDQRIRFAFSEAGGGYMVDCHKISSDASD